ncbi:unnamed protein product, partial [Didymodactylos carnosus]
GGIDSEIEDHGIYIKTITPNGAAEESKSLLEGDKILEVNGIPLYSVSHSEAVDVFRKSSTKCHLLVQRYVFPSIVRKSPLPQRHIPLLYYPFSRPDNTFEVILQRSHLGLGLSLAGGSGENKPIEIVEIYPNQSAAASGKLNEGDILLQINDILMHNRNVHDVPTIINESPQQTVKLVVCRPDPNEYRSYIKQNQQMDINQYLKPSITHSGLDISSRSPTLVPNESKLPRDLPPKSPSTRRITPVLPKTKPKRGEVFSIILHKTSDSGLGFTLSSGQSSIGFSHIRSVVKEPALSGGLKHWDRIVSINGHNCLTITHRDLVARLRYAAAGPVHLHIYRPNIEEIVTAKERSRQKQQESSFLNFSMVDIVSNQTIINEQNEKIAISPPTIKRHDSINDTSLYEKILITLPKAPQGTYGIGLNQIDPQQAYGGIYICALQPNSVALKDGRLKTDDRILLINGKSVEHMTYREVVETLKISTKKGVDLLVARSTDNQELNQPNVKEELAHIVSNTANITNMFVSTMPRRNSKLSDANNELKLPIQHVISPDSIESSSSTAGIEEKKSEIISSHHDNEIVEPPTKSIENNEPKEQPLPTADTDDDISDIKTPPISPRTPTESKFIQQELDLPPPKKDQVNTTSNVKSTNDNQERMNFFQQATTNEILLLNAGVAERVEDLTPQKINKISTPAVTMDTSSLMDEHREIELKIDSQEYIEEFKALKMLNDNDDPELSSVALLPENKIKNRFKNVIPYDYNRVKLLSIKPDYINASHLSIPIGVQSMKYIVCPPPVPESVHDFWQMIVEQKVKCILGIFRDQDLKKMKCPSYYPTELKETMTLSPQLSVSLIKERHFQDINVKEFVLGYNGVEHRLIFLTYTQWTEDNVPFDSIHTFLQFIHLGHSYQVTESPLLIHCNTGIGRTSCALMISLTLSHMIRGQTINIYNLGKQCRLQRSGFIQTQEQYRFIYECTKTALNLSLEFQIMQLAQE